MKSIMQDEKECYISGVTVWLEEHHIFGASNRKWSEKYGLKVYLTHMLHNEPPYGIHFNKDMDLRLKREGQKAFQQRYPDLDFMKIFGRNYL